MRIITTLIFAFPAVLAFLAAAWVYVATGKDEGGATPVWARSLPISLLLGLGILCSFFAYGMATFEGR